MTNGRHCWGCDVMTRNHVFASNKLRAAWDDVMASMRRMYQFCEHRPDDFHAVFQAVAGEANEVKFNIAPVVFAIPERLGKTHKLYIAVDGWLSFESEGIKDGPLKTKAFGTHVGYFKARGTNIEHVFGAHYDLDESSPGHPVFHAQLQDMSEMAGHVCRNFRLNGEVENSFRPQVRNIRIPCAQMDVFSAILQMCADHLVIKGVDGEVAQVFANMCGKSNYFIGAAHRISYINNAAASGCFRSWHWYGGDRISHAATGGE